MRNISMRKVARVSFNDAWFNWDLYITNNYTDTATVRVVYMDGKQKIDNYKPGQSVNYPYPETIVGIDVTIKDSKFNPISQKTFNSTDIQNSTKDADSKWVLNLGDLFLATSTAPASGAATPTVPASGAATQKSSPKPNQATGKNVKITEIQNLLLSSGVKSKMGNDVFPGPADGIWGPITNGAFANAVSVGKQLNINSASTANKDLDYAITFLKELEASGQTTTSPPAVPAAGPTTPAQAVVPAADPAAPKEDKSQDVLKKIFQLIVVGQLKIDGKVHRAETKVWKGVIEGLGGAEKAAAHVLNQGVLTVFEKNRLSGVNTNSDEGINAFLVERNKILDKINTYFYELIKKHTKDFIGVRVMSENQIAKKISEKVAKVASATSLERLNILSKVAGRRERAIKNLEDVIEKEASSQTDDMTSAVKRRRAAAREKLGL